MKLKKLSTKYTKLTNTPNKQLVPDDHGNPGQNKELRNLFRGFRAFRGQNDFFSKFIKASCACLESLLSAIDGLAGLMQDG